MPSSAPRKNDLAKIHIAIKDLGMDDDAYRAMLWTVARVRSAKDLDAHGRSKVLHHLRSVGWRPKRRRDPGNVKSDRDALVGKIKAQLTDLKLPWKYADAIAMRMHSVNSVRFANPEQLRDIVAALAYEQRRQADRCCPECGGKTGHAEGCPEGE
jgi:phage gp16-like protein